jgi:hypothetical protein
MLEAVMKFMVAWTEWPIGLVPFALIALLLWMRLQAAGAPPQLAARIIFGLFVWVGFVVLGLAMAALGWKGGNAWLLTAGMFIAVTSFLILRQRLQRLWEDFPLPVSENEEKRGKAVGTDNERLGKRGSDRSPTDGNDNDFRRSGVSRE